MWYSFGIHPHVPSIYLFLTFTYTMVSCTWLTWFHVTLVHLFAQTIFGQVAQSKKIRINIQNQKKNAHVTSRQADRLTDRQVDRSTGWQVDRLAGEFTVSTSICQPDDLSTYRPVDLSICQLVNQSTCRPVILSICHSQRRFVLPIGLGVPKHD